MQRLYYTFLNFFLRKQRIGIWSNPDGTAKEMFDKVEKQGVLSTIIKKACKISEELLADLGRWRQWKGLFSFPWAHHRTRSGKLSTKLELKPRSVRSLSEEQLSCRFPKHLRSFYWNWTCTEIIVKLCLLIFLFYRTINFEIKMKGSHFLQFRSNNTLFLPYKSL